MDAAIGSDCHSNRIWRPMQGIELNGKVGPARKLADARVGRWGDAAPLRMNRSGAVTAARHQFAEQP
jgi:hypothetical protein